MIYADPPWRFEPYSRDTGMDRAADNHYPTCTTDEICALPVSATWRPMTRAVPVGDRADDRATRCASCRRGASSTSRSSCGTRRSLGTGYWFRNQHELLLVGTRGKVPAPARGHAVAERDPGAARRAFGEARSALELIEAYFPTLPKIELYGRGESRLGWDAWGNEVLPPMPATPVPDTELRYVPR